MKRVPVYFVCVCACVLSVLSMLSTRFESVDAIIIRILTSALSSPDNQQSRAWASLLHLPRVRVRNFHPGVSLINGSS